MAIIDSIQKAQEMGASSQAILAEIEKQNPSKAATIKQAKQMGASDDVILNEFIKQNQPTLLQKAGDLSGRALRFGAETAKEIVAQPARATQQIGTGIGEKLIKTYKGKEYLSPVSFGGKLAGQVLSPLFNKQQAQQFRTSTYGGVQPTQSLKQGTGQAMQAASNLTLPFQINPLGLGLGTGAFTAGKTLEEGGSSGQAAFSGGIGFGLGTGIGLGGRFIGKPIAEGLKPVYQNTMKSISEFLAPKVANVSKPVMNWATTNAERVVPKLETYIAAAEKQAPEEAEAVLRKELLSTAQNLYKSAKNKVENTFESGFNRLKVQYPDAKANIPAIAKDIQNRLPRFGKPTTVDEEKALEAVLKTLRSPREYTLDGIKILANELWDLVQRTEQGTPARRAAMAGWTQVRNEMSKMTNGSIDKIFAPYAAFKKKSLDVKPLWSEKVTEDTARNFVSSLENISKGGSLDAVKYFERLAKNAPKVTEEIKAKNVAKKLSAELPVAGGTISRYTSPAALGALGGAAGAGAGSLFGPGGAMAGAGVGTALGSSILPSILSPKNLATRALQTVEQPVVSGARKAIGNVIQNPSLTGLASRTLSGLLFGKK